MLFTLAMLRLFSSQQFIPYQAVVVRRVVVTGMVKLKYKDRFELQHTVLTLMLRLLSSISQEQKLFENHLNPVMLVFI